MLEHARLKWFESHCTQDAPPGCQRACPLDMDARAFLKAVSESRLTEARKIIERHLPIPHILCSVCDHPCENSCIRRDFGGTIAISALERFCLANTDQQTRFLKRATAKNQQVAIMGAGIAGLAAAFELSRKGYPVTVFDHDRQKALLNMFPDLESSAILQTWADLEKQGVRFSERDFSDRNVAEELLKQAEGDFSAIFIDVSRFPFGPSAADISSLTLHWRANICAGGWFSTTPLGAPYPSASRQAGEGRTAAITIERLLENVSLEAERRGTAEGQLHVDLAGVAFLEPVLPRNGQYNPAEAAEEAGRCLPCTCLQCVKKCVYLKKYKEYPRLYARRLFGNATVVRGTRTKGNQIMNGCALCGQCEEICPEGFSMTELCLEARRDAVERDVMPDSAHAFALEDMVQACSPESAFLMPDPDPKGQAQRLFFPGCQLAGARPVQVLAMRQWLADNLAGGVALLSSCCGIPAYWAGREEMLKKHAEELRGQWEKCGKPEIIAACSSCLTMFKSILPGAAIISLWEVLDELMPEQIQLSSSDFAKELAIQDPCGARHNSAWREAVRSLAGKAGIKLLEPANTGLTTACCGYGGLVWNAQPELADAMTRNRLQEFSAPILTSCIMCRERFSENDEDVSQNLHMFDILPQTAGIKSDNSCLGLSGRRAGRILLREMALGQRSSGAEFPVRISREALENMERNFILRQDVIEAIKGIEKTGAKFQDHESGNFLGSWRPRNVTFWVEYSVDADGGYSLARAWCHRMVIPGAIQPATEVQLEKRIRG